VIAASIALAVIVAAVAAWLLWQRDSGGNEAGTTARGFVFATCGESHICMRLRRLILLSVPGLAALVACQPVTGDVNDNSPPTISFRVAGQVVTSPQAFQSLPEEGLTVVAADPGGMTSLHVTNIVVSDCVAVGRREVQSAQLIEIPATAYSTTTHSYQSPTFGEFWPDVDGDKVKDPSEFPLRFDELIQPIDLEYYQSINGIDSGPCTMSDGSPGTAIVRQILVEAYAVNFRGSILATDAATAYEELVLTVA
jgi:hypothetical protein